MKHVGAAGRCLLAYLPRDISRRRIHWVKREPVQWVSDSLGLAVDVDNLDIGRGERARECRRSPWRLACPIKVGGSKYLGRLDILVAKGSLGILLRNLLDGV